MTNSPSSLQPSRKRESSATSDFRTAFSHPVCADATDAAYQGNSAPCAVGGDRLLFVYAPAGEVFNVTFDRGDKHQTTELTAGL